MNREGRGLTAPRPMPEEAREDCSKNYDVNIREVENGFIVNVGCKTFVIKTLKELLNGLETFYIDFEKAKETYLTK